MIYVLGSINFDLVVFLKKFPLEGETVRGDSILFNLGGKGANQAISIKKLNGDVLFIGRVGDDYFGKFLLDNLKNINLNYRINIDKKSNSGLAIINVDEKGNNKIVIFEGANGNVGDEEIGVLKENLNENDFVLMQGEIPFDSLMKASLIVKEKKGKLIFDPAPARIEFLSLLPYVEYLTPNETELETLTKGIKNFDDKINFLLEKGAYAVIVKLGEKGIFYKDKENKSFKMDSFKVKAVDTTAAGDIFNGAFATCLDKKFNLEYSIKFGQASAAISVTRKGASISCPSYDEVIRFLEVMDEKNHN